MTQTKNFNNKPISWNDGELIKIDSTAMEDVQS